MNNVQKITLSPDLVAKILKEQLDFIVAQCVGAEPKALVGGESDKRLTA